MLERGAVEKKIINDAIKFRMPIPDKILNAPQLRFGLELFYLGFLDLSSCRISGGGSLGPIPYTALIAYCQTHDIVGSQFEDFVWFVTRLDEKYISWKAHNGAQNQRRSTCEKANDSGR